MIEFERVQKFLARAASVGIAGAAVVLTYAGTVQFAHEHGAPGWRGYTIAAMNDAAVLVGIAWPARPLQALAGLCAALTVWANFAHAAPGWEGAVVALTPPALAILMIAALEVVYRAEVAGRPVLSAPVSPPVSTEVDTAGPARVDTGGDTRADTDRTLAPDTTGQDTPTGQDTGVDTGQDTPAADVDTGQDTARGGQVVSISSGRERDQAIDRVEAGELTQKAAAELLGCSTKTISRALAARARAAAAG